MLLICLIPTCNEAYQTPVTSNIRLISSQVTRKVSSMLLDYVLKVEQGLGLSMVIVGHVEVVTYQR